MKHSELYDESIYRSATGGRDAMLDLAKASMNFTNRSLDPAFDGDAEDLDLLGAYALRYSGTQIMDRLRHVEGCEQTFWKIHKWINARRRRLVAAGVIVANAREGANAPITPMTTLYIVLQWCMQHPHLLQDYFEWLEGELPSTGKARSRGRRGAKGRREPSPPVADILSFPGPTPDERRLLDVVRREGLSAAALADNLYDDAAKSADQFREVGAHLGAAFDQAIENPEGDRATLDALRERVANAQFKATVSLSNLCVREGK